MERGLWGIADGSEKKPETTDEKVKKAWVLRSDKAYSVIALSVIKDLQVHITSTTDAHKAWTILKDHFEVTSVSQIVRVSRKFYAASMEEGADLLKFITKMTALAQELRELGEDVSSKKFATVILGSLPESYGIFLTSLNARPAAELTWETIQGKLTEEYLNRKEKVQRQEEDNHNHNNHNFEGEEALFTQSRGSYYSGRGNYSNRGGRGGGRSGRRGRGGYNQSGGARNHPYNNNNRDNRNNRG